MNTKRRWVILLVVACMGYFIFGCGGGGGKAVEKGDEPSPVIVDYLKLFDCIDNDFDLEANEEADEKIGDYPPYISYGTAIEALTRMGADEETAGTIMTCFAEKELEATEYPEDVEQEKIENCISAYTLGLHGEACELTALMDAREAPGDKYEDLICKDNFERDCFGLAKDLCITSFSALGENNEPEFHNCFWDEDDGKCYIAADVGMSACTDGEFPEGYPPQPCSSEFFDGWCEHFSDATTCADSFVQDGGMFYNCTWESGTGCRQIETECTDGEIPNYCNATFDSGYECSDYPKTEDVCNNSYIEKYGAHHNCFWNVGTGECEMENIECAGGTTPNFCNDGGPTHSCSGYPMATCEMYYTILYENDDPNTGNSENHKCIWSDTNGVCIPQGTYGDEWTCEIDPNA